MPGIAQPRAVFLVGFMGAGKTSVGRALAAMLGWRFLDLDERIERGAGRSISEMFAALGEASFRALETAALRESVATLAHAEPAVIALGGGAFVQPENAEMLEAAALPVVFLDAAVEVLLERCRPAAGSRPLFADEGSFRDLYAARRPHYERASVRVDTGGKAVEDAAREIATALGLEIDSKGMK